LIDLKSSLLFLNLYRNKAVDVNEQFQLCSQQGGNGIKANAIGLNSKSSIESDHTVDKKPHKQRFRKRKGTKSKNKNNSDMKS
jgi:hypothetical protein